MTKKNIKEKAKQNDDVSLREKITSEYIRYYLQNGKNPPSVFVFCEDLEISEQNFYDEFSSFDALQKEIWNNMVVTTINTLQANDEYMKYSSREKLLSFYYTLIEVLKKNRSFVLATYDRNKMRELKPKYLHGIRETFFEYVNSLLEDGIQNEEVKKRPYISDKYNEALWIQFLFVLHFWIKDDSKGFENTDAAIEKAVKLSSELMGEGPVDSFIDLAKFIYQNAR